MSYQQVVNQQNAVTTAPDTSAMTPDAMVEQLRALRAQIPEYVQLSPVDRKSRVPLTSLNRDFAQAAISAIGASPKVEALVGQSPENLQGDIETANRWSMVEDELRAMLSGVSSANLVRRHRVGRALLLTYAVSKRLVQTPENASLLPHLDDMRRANRLRRSRKAHSQPQVPTPNPVPEPQV